MKRRQFLRAAVGTASAGTVFSIYNGSTVAQSDEAWPQSGYDASNSGHASNNTGPTTGVEQRWVFDDLGVRGANSEPAVVGGTIYIGSPYGLYALSVDDGTVRWRFGDRTNIEFGTPAVIDGTVFVGSRSEGITYALSAQDGTEQWTFEANSESAPTVADGTVYIGTTSTLYALSAGNGSERWRFSPRLHSLGPSSPAVSNGTVYIRSERDDLKLYALAAEDGSQEWSYEAETNLESSPAVDDGTVYTIDRDGILYAVSTDGGSEKWTFDTLGSGSSPPRIADGTVFVGSRGDDGVVYALDSANGDIKWEFGTDSDVYAAPAIAGDVVYVTSRMATIYALDASDGDELWSVDVGGRVFESPVVANGAVYFAGNENVFAFQEPNETSTPTNTTESTTTNTTEPTPNGTENENETDLLPVGLGLLGVGGAGLWWLTRDGDDEADTGSSAGATIVEGDHSTPPSTPANGLGSDEPSSGDPSAATTDKIDHSSDSGTASPTDKTHGEPRLAPDEIPRAPDVSVEYDALKSKKLIGGGGNADVTKAVFSTSDGDVTLAIKEPRMSGTLHTETVERMLEEAETWDKLDDHDHIVGVIDYGSAPIPWIAMEFMDAGHLGDRSGELDTVQALWTAIGVTKGVRHAHRRGVAHLDLKPENILFRSVEDGWDVPKVADWGLSKHLLEHSKSIEGLSPQYAAPEQFDEDFGSADDITDIYQLGAVFYELFTGRPPFEGKPAKAMHKVLDKEPTLPSEIADVPEELDEILLTALAKKKDDRYDNIVYLRDELQDLYEEC